MPVWIDVLLTIKPYASTDSVRWDDFVERSLAATFCHLSGWQRVVERTWQYRQHSLYAERDGHIAGVLPLFHISGLWFGSIFGTMLLSTPNAVYGGVVAADIEARQALIASAQALAADLKVDYLELRDAGLSQYEIPAEKFHRRDLYFTFERPLVADEDALMKSLPRDVRRMIRQGVQHGLSAELGREELLDDFFEVYAASVHNLGTPVFPKKLFANFLREFPATSDILLIRQNRKVAGAVLSFYFRDVVMPYYGGAYREFHRAGVNNFMYWELMRQSAQRGYTRFDFGRSKIGTGAYEFKRGWRMTERPLPYQFFPVCADEVPNLNPTNPKFKLMIEVWKRLPLGLTKLIGPKIVRNFP
ncbi:MAG: FemAB family XrtA/PEP-CTERM system-associated protein [Acidobacteriota bacterium]